MQQHQKELDASLSVRTGDNRYYDELSELARIFFGDTTMHDFTQVQWDEDLINDCHYLIRLAIREDLGRSYDCTTVALIPPEVQGRAVVTARREGILCGFDAAQQVLQEMEISEIWEPLAKDGQMVTAGTRLASLRGSARDLLTSERLILNFIGRLSGIATLTRQFVDAVAGTNARIYDTRKTTPGWRRLEKFAVRCGGGRNHRTGLYDAILIKDNHLALRNDQLTSETSPGSAVEVARTFASELRQTTDSTKPMLIEIEVDTLQQFDSALHHHPDIILLDNMSTQQLSDAVARRDRIGSAVELEASGGITLDTVQAIAATGVDRISVGSLTHSAVALDVGLDWLPVPGNP